MAPTTSTELVNGRPSLAMVVMTAGLLALNALAIDLELEKVQEPVKRLLASGPKVDRLIRVLEPRCQTAVLAGRLRDAVHKHGI